jgi:hypothetical protein
MCDGANVSAEDENGRTSMHGAAANPDRRVDREHMLLEHEDMKVWFYDNSTLLHIMVAGRGRTCAARAWSEH